MDYRSRIKNRSHGPIPGWWRQYSRRHTKPALADLRVATTSRHVPVLGQATRTFYHRQIRYYGQHTPPALQQQTLGPIYQWRQRLSATRLGDPQQLRQPTLQTHPPRASSATAPASHCNHYRPLVARPTLVPDLTRAQHLSPRTNPQVPKDPRLSHTPGRAAPQPQVAPVRLEDMWWNKLFSLGWSHRAAAQLPLCWATSTKQSYNRAITEFLSF